MEVVERQQVHVGGALLVGLAGTHRDLVGQRPGPGDGHGVRRRRRPSGPAARSAPPPTATAATTAGPPSSAAKFASSRPSSDPSGRPACLIRRMAGMTAVNSGGRRAKHRGNSDRPSGRPLRSPPMAPSGRRPTAPRAEARPPSSRAGRAAPAAARPRRRRRRRGGGRRRRLPPAPRGPARPTRRRQLGDDLRRDHGAGHAVPGARRDGQRRGRRASCPPASCRGCLPHRPALAVPGGGGGRRRPARLRVRLGADRRAAGRPAASPPAAALAFLLSAPAINPVVLVATAVAFPGRPEVVLARFLASLLAATVVGLVWARTGRRRPARSGTRGAARRRRAARSPCWSPPRSTTCCTPAAS